MNWQMYFYNLNIREYVISLEEDIVCLILPYLKFNVYSNFVLTRFQKYHFYSKAV